MDLIHRFTVPTSVEATWDHFTDLASVAECFPGAQVTSVEGDSFAGSVKVKLGPIALQYNGAGSFVAKDDAARRMVIEAKGKDKRGNGTAGALVTLTMSPSGASGATDVEVITDLAITGKPAQFGRGVMQDVSDKLLGQFVACLEQRLAADASLAPAAPAPAAASTAGSTETPLADAVEAAVADGAVAGEPVADEASDGTAGGTADAAADGVAERSGAAPTEAPAPRPEHHRLPPVQHEEAIDLGATVLPVLAKAYWKQALAGIVVVGLILRWLRRR